MQRTYVTVCGTSVSLSGRRFRGLDCAKPRPPQREAQRSGEYSRPVSGLNLRGGALFLMGVSGERGTWVRTTLRRTGMSGPSGTRYTMATPGRSLSESLSLGFGPDILAHVVAVGHSSSQIGVLRCGADQKRRQDEIVRALQWVLQRGVAEGPYQNMLVSLIRS